MKHLLMACFALSLFACGGSGASSTDSGTDSNSQVSGSVSESTIPDIEGNWHCTNNCVQDFCLFSDAEVYQDGSSFEIYSSDTGQSQSGTIHSDGAFTFSGDGVFCSGTYAAGYVTSHCSIDGHKCGTVKYIK